MVPLTGLVTGGGGMTGRGSSVEEEVISIRPGSGRPPDMLVGGTGSSSGRRLLWELGIPVAGPFIAGIPVLSAPTG